jgi:hypothetical protein
MFFPLHGLCRAHYPAMLVISAMRRTVAPRFDHPTRSIYFKPDVLYLK